MASQPIELGVLPVALRPSRRLSQLFVGLMLYGASMALMVRSGLGLDPWDVLHEGLTRRTGLSFGTVTALTGVAVLVGWIPLRQRPGLGTVSNVLVIALSVDLVLAVLPTPTSLGVRSVFMVAGIILNALATAAYIGARLGPGPRDGLMTGLCARTQWSLRLVRTAIELTVLGTGWLLGGTVGLGTVLYALAIGPLTQFLLPYVVIQQAPHVEAA
jgi:uncharacterized membrane protein YczE